MMATAPDGARTCPRSTRSGNMDAEVTPMGAPRQRLPQLSHGTSAPCRPANWRDRARNRTALGLQSRRSMDQLTRSRFARLVGIVALAAASACLSRPLEPIDPALTLSISDTLPQSRIDKIDILLAIDNSGSMADKQDILAQAVPRLVTALLNPPCVGENDEILSTPASPLDICPAGSRREFEPVLDIHIGVLSSSLGGRGGSLCADTAPMNDNGQLIHRIDASDPEAGLATFENKGFLVWRPEAPGAQTGLYQDLTQRSTDMEAIVRGVGENGCGLEAQLESFYRFLIDPDPYLEVTKTFDEGGLQAASELSGIDEALLQQRRDFVRPDSLV